MITLRELLEELLRFREAPTAQTAGFKSNHDELCSAFQSQINAMGDSFLKYDQISYIVQGPRDQGVDVLLKTSSGDDTESFVGIQIKSYGELEDRDSTLSKNLKSAFFDARNHYGSNLQRYYIALCGDAKRHALRISAITTEFAKEPAVRVIGPRYLFTFVNLPDIKLSAIVDYFLREDDEVRKAARSEVYGLNEAEIYFLLTCLVWSFENQSDHLPSDFLASSRISDFGNRYGSDALQEVFEKMQGVALQVEAKGPGTRIQSEQYPAIRAMYYDIRVRYDIRADQTFAHLFEFLCLFSNDPESDAASGDDDEDF
jgi:hypothetical protein